MAVKENSGEKWNQLKSFNDATQVITKLQWRLKKESNQWRSQSARYLLLTE